MDNDNDYQLAFADIGNPTPATPAAAAAAAVGITTNTQLHFSPDHSDSLATVNNLINQLHALRSLGHAFFSKAERALTDPYTHEAISADLSSIDATLDRVTSLSLQSGFAATPPVNPSATSGGNPVNPSAVGLQVVDSVDLHRRIDQFAADLDRLPRVIRAAAEAARAS